MNTESPEQQPAKNTAQPPSIPDDVFPFGGVGLGCAEQWSVEASQEIARLRSQLQTARQTIERLEEDLAVYKRILDKQGKLLAPADSIKMLLEDRDQLKSDLAKVTKERDEARQDRGQLAAQRIGEMGLRQLAERDIATLRTKLDGVLRYPIVHKVECATGAGPDRKCSCGLDEFLTLQSTATPSDQPAEKCPTCGTSDSLACSAPFHVPQPPQIKEE